MAAQQAATNYYQSIRDALKDETNSGNLYATLAKEAPSTWERDTLMEMAREEIMHRAHLECILLECDGK